MAKDKACKNCRAVYTGEKCPKCGSTETSSGFKGKVEVLDSEKSEIAKKVGIKEKGSYAIKV